MVSPRKDSCENPEGMKWWQEPLEEGAGAGERASTSFQRDGPLPSFPYTPSHIQGHTNSSGGGGGGSGFSCLLFHVQHMFDLMC